MGGDAGHEHQAGPEREPPQTPAGRHGDGSEHGQCGERARRVDEPLDRPDRGQADHRELKSLEHAAAVGPARRHHRGHHHEHRQAEAKWPVLSGKAADRPEQVVDQHHHRERHRRRGQQPRSAGQPQDAVPGRVDQREQEPVEQPERAVADRGQLEPGGEEVDRSHAVLRGGVDQHGAAVQDDVGRAEDEVVVKLRDRYPQGLDEVAGPVGRVEDHEIRDGQQEQGDHRQVEDHAQAPRRPGQAAGPEAGEGHPRGRGGHESQPERDGTDRLDDREGEQRARAGRRP